jgi:hypothetical protein
MFSKLWKRHCYFLLVGAFAQVVICAGQTHGQVEPCPDPAPQTTGTHRFRRAGDRFEIPIRLADCQTLGLDLRWSNGANSGSNFIVTFLDDQSQPIFSKQIWGFMTGNHQFPFTTLEWLGTASMMAVPVSVTIQAVEPFAFPSSISYRVTRISYHPKRKLSEIDANLATSLRTTPGKLITEGPLSESFSYRLEQLVFDQPREIERHGKKETIENAFRLTLKGGEFSNMGLIWIDDVALPAFLTSDHQSIITLIYDASILRDGAEISVSQTDSSQLRLLGERLKLPANFRPAGARPTEEGNSIVSIKRAVRSIGSSRFPLIQVELRTSRPFPARQSPLQLQVGKRFFLNELTGDYSGRKLTLTLTPEMFAEFKDGAEIVAFFDRPDRSGFAAQDIWFFGRLNKSMLDQ